MSDDERLRGAAAVVAAGLPPLSAQTRDRVAVLFGAAGTARPVPAADGGADIVVATLSWEAGLNDVVQGEDPLLTVAEIARGLGIRPSTWRGYVTRGEAPPADEPDADRPPARRMPRWRQSSVAAWKAGRKRGSYKKAGDGE